MLMLILENRQKYPLDEVVFYDTGMEFEAIYKTRDKVKEILKKEGIKFTELKPKMEFRDKMYNYPHYSRTGKLKQGYGWCGGLCRWGTSEKLQAIKSHCKDCIQYVGIAIDEVERLKRLGENKISVLAEMGYTEKMALQYCYDRGFDWLETKGGKGPIRLYDILDRVSCWCCRNKNLKELENYKRYLPNYYKKLEELEELIGEPMKKPILLKDRFNSKQISIFDL